MHFRLKSLFTLFLLWYSCQAQEPVTQIDHPGGEHTLLLYADKAADAITTDTYNHYFDRITAVEMSIQMKKALKDGQTRADLLPGYLEVLGKDVDQFSDSESNWVARIMEDVYTTTEEHFPGVYPDTMLLIKTSANTTGESVYYTRANSIVIPYDVLRARDEKAFRSTMLHELFHVYSRLNPDKQKELYALIGFESIGYDNLVMPELLASRLLHNPDGVDFAQKIDLRQDDGSVISAIPVIYANKDGYQKGQDVFFSYLAFELFEVRKNDEGMWEVQTRPDGLHSTLDMRQQPDFFAQIKDNTGYIIHPDEILADNFTFLVESKTNPERTAKFSEEGKALIDSIESILKQ